MNLLVVLDALLTERSVGRAGTRLGLSQPAVSRALARLRELLGDEILVRSGSRMLATPRASGLAPALRRQLHGVVALFERGNDFDPSRSARVFTLAATDYAERVIVVPFLETLRQRAPSLGFVVRPAVQGELRRAETGDIDVGIAPVPADAPGLLRRLLFADPYVVALRRDHPFLRRAQARRVVSAAEYAALLHVRVSPDGHGPSALDDVLAARRLARRVVYRTHTFAAALATAAATDLALTVPSQTLQFPEASGLVALPLRFIAPLEVHLVRHERFATDPGNCWLVQQLLESAHRLRASRPISAR